MIHRRAIYILPIYRKRKKGKYRPHPRRSSVHKNERRGKFRRRMAP